MGFVDFRIGSKKFLEIYLITASFVFRDYEIYKEGFIRDYARLIF
jgi:hypothetical protein